MVVAGLPALVLFARAPVLGAVKTRLTPALTEEGVLSLYAAFLEDAARVYARTSRWEPVLAALPDPDDPTLTRLFGPPWRRQAQAPGDLGARLEAAFDAERERGAPAVLAVGADHPALPIALVEEAFEAVRLGSDAALIPAQDGGYCAIALNARVPPAAAFRGVPWSTPEVLAVTRAGLAAAGLNVATLGAAYDVDRPEDLDRLRADLARRDPRAPDYPRATALALAALDAEAVR
ncbi:MAG: TIGR04282 family arsenosugar biosynthesis glycosyltransferase [Thermoanaerobaculia bacterium]